MSNIQLVEFEPSQDKSERKRFIQLAWDLNKNDPAWVPPLRLTVEDTLDTKKNPFYKHARIRLWNAYRDGKHVGRISATIDDRHNEFHGEKVGFWGFLETIEDKTVTDALFKAAEAWVKAQGMSACRGPMNPSTNHECGMLINNFGHEPYMMMTHNLAYYPGMVEAQGYAKIKDLYAFNLKAPQEFEPRIAKVAELVKKKGNIRFRPIDMKNFQRDVDLIREIYNDAWEKNWGFVPTDDAEFAHMAKSMKDVIWPNYCLLAFIEDKPIGFSLSLPDINQVLKEIPSGKLLPFGIFKLLNGLRPKAKKINRVRVITLGVKKAFRGTGVASVFYYETYKQCMKDGMWGGEASWILEDNREMLSAIESFGGVPPYKTYRIYEKLL
jgi:hypothetical protein